MAGRAAEGAKHLLPMLDGTFDLAVARDHLPGHRHHRLVEGDGADIRARQLVAEAIAVRIGVGPEPFGRLDAVMVIERGVSEVAQRHRIAGLMPGPQQQAGRINRRGGDQAGARQALHFADVPQPVLAAAQAAEVDALGHQHAGFAAPHAVTRALQFDGHFACQHFDVAGPEHARRVTRIADAGQRDRLAALVHGAARRRQIGPVKGGEVETLSLHEHIGREVAAAAGDAERLVVATGARVGVGAGDAVEGARPGQRRAGVGQAAPVALGQRPTGALFHSPVGGKDPAPMFEQLRQAEVELLIVRQMRIEAQLLADAGLAQRRIHLRPGPAGRGRQAGQQQGASQPPA